MEGQQQQVRILLVSDTHCALDKVGGVASRIPSLGITCVVCAGDLSNYVHGREDILTSMQAQHDANEVLNALERGHDVPVYFLPGNHDAPSLLVLEEQGEGKRSKVGTRAINVHGEVGLKIAPGLRVCGLGGSVPAVQGGYIVWDGFPYTEQQNGNHLQRLWNKASALDGQVLLVTHCGPYDVGTTVCMKDPNREPIQSGSTNLRRLLCQSDVQQKVVANLHGHSHDASGMAQVGRIPVINAGALVEDRYAIVDLKRASDGTWGLQGVQFCKL